MRGKVQRLSDPPANSPHRPDPTVTSADEESASGFRADSLALGMVIMLALTIVQRGVGFLRGIWFCRLLDDTDLGRWAMAFGFITLITPVLLFGIPGSLPRYVEHFRIRGQLPAFLRRVLLATVACGSIAIIATAILPDWFGWLIFLEPQDRRLVQAVAAAMVATIAFNFVNDLNASLRQVRVVSLMQFMQGVGFTFGGIGWLAGGGGFVGLVVTFAVTTLLATAPGLVSLRRGWGGLPPATTPLDTRAMWRRLIPYAAALWMMNLLGNVFELSDRSMILHFTPGGGEAGQSAVGQFHSARIFPELLLSLASMVSGVLLPYMAADWETGRFDAVRNRLRRVLLAASVVCTLGGAAVLWLSPWLFGTLLQGRYREGMDLLPAAFVFCSWSALIAIAQDYLCVVERAKLVAIALAIGLIANLGLNAWLIPIWGLPGAVTATLIANAVVGAGVWVGMVACGYGVDRSTAFVAILPATLLAGPAVSVIAVAVTLMASAQARVWVAESVESLDAWITRPRRSETT